MNRICSISIVEYAKYIHILYIRWEWLIFEKLDLIPIHSPVPVSLNIRVMCDVSAMFIIAPDGDTMSFDGSLSFLYLSNIDEFDVEEVKVCCVNVILFPILNDFVKKERKVVCPSSDW